MPATGASIRRRRRKPVRSLFQLPRRLRCREDKVPRVGFAVTPDSPHPPLRVNLRRRLPEELAAREFEKECRTDLVSNRMMYFQTTRARTTMLEWAAVHCRRAT